MDSDPRAEILGQEMDQHGMSVPEAAGDDMPPREIPTCRICRGEETPEEPLFYPCKCNGSIRFVHQECLMEWLSRSQKRHCELCKTPFRFTKLYDPQMPPSVPLPVFLRQAVVQVGRAILRILRYILVTFVWLCWVPWTMRTMWRFLFWLGDGAWIDHRDPFLFPGLAAGRVYGGQATNSTHPATDITNGTFNSRTFTNSTLSPFESFIYSVHNFLFSMTNNEDPPRPQQVDVAQFNYQPLMLRLGRQILRRSLSLSRLPQAVNSTTNGPVNSGIPRQATMLSDVKYLQTLSRWPAVNSTVIDVLEGQLITLFVMVLIILVFLIREWVVQQQPNLAAPRALEPLPAEDANRDAEEIEPQNANLGPAAVGNERVNDPATSDGSEELLDGNIPSIPRAESRVSHLESEDLSNEQPVSPDRSVVQPQRPPMQRHALNRASELQRILEEEREKVEGDKWPSVQTFMDYWHRGDCSPQNVLDLIHGEGKGEELVWIVKAMERLMSEGVLASEQDDDIQSGGGSGILETSHQDGSGSSDESWQVLEEDSIGQLNADSSSTANPTRRPSVPNLLHLPNLSWPPAEGSPDSEVSNSALPDVAERVLVSEELDASGTGQTHAASNTSARPFEQELDAAPGEVLDEHAGAELDVRPRAETTPEDAEHERLAAPDRTFWDSLANLLWGNVELPAAEQQEVATQLGPILQPEVEHGAQVQQVGDARDGRDLPAGPPGPDANIAAGLLPPQDPEVLRAAREAGVQPEEIQAIEDADDLDGLVELIGLQGPLVALIQHGMVCGAIVTLVVFFGIWIPYVIGKVVLVLISNPLTLLVKLPLRWTSLAVNMLIDLSISTTGYAFFWLDWGIRFFVSPIGWILPLFARLQQNTDIPDTAFSYASKSMERLSKTFTGDTSFRDNDIPIFSVIAHESLIRLQDRSYRITLASYHWLEATLKTPLSLTTIAKGTFSLFSNLPIVGIKWLQWEWEMLSRIASNLAALSHTNPFKLRLEFPERSEPLNLELIEWNTRDRVLAIMLGYVAFYAIGTMYVRMKQATRNTNAVRDEALEILSQAGGVLKVILIISIEMIAFPLYCGLLLDIAMLPLFEDRNPLTRLMFAVENPLTAVFLHWFVGTCYMFHFALFVSMCRKSMRSGVLYFIRDPDDPTFHPVRDVLERNLVGQLRKILFSALVYGGLVIVCLGAVVWGVAAFPTTIFPIRWSTLDPSTELPIDLIVLNFLIPVAVKVLDPSQGLEAMYKWWFRRCAKGLRLSHFLFNERNEDEEGHWVTRIPEAESATSIDQSSASADQERSSEDDGNTTHISDTGPADVFKSHSPGKAGDESDPAQLTSVNRQGHFVRDGRFVRAPASDQVRIPRNQRTFLPVDEKNNSIDGVDEPVDGSLHAKSNALFQVVWLPPHFRLRIGLFIFLLWTFAAFTGLGVTILPLLCGRLVFQTYLPANAPVNDVHAFCFGAYVFGGPVFLAIKYHTNISQAYGSVRRWLATNLMGRDVAAVLQKTVALCIRTFRVVYFYSCFGFILPTLLSTVLEFYFFIPLTSHLGARFDLEARHAKISLIQNWTVGILYLRIIGRFIHNNQESRPARALFALVAPANNGASWWDPDIQLATRAFFLPSLALIGAALVVPFGLASVANAVYFKDAAPVLQTLVYRYSYPALAVSIVMALLVRAMIGAYRTWRSRIRDEVYLIGERLHNFGQGKNEAAAQVDVPA